MFEYKSFFSVLTLLQSQLQYKYTLSNSSIVLQANTTVHNSTTTLHSEDTEFSLGEGGVLHRQRERQTQDLAGVGGVDDSIIPQTCGGVECVALLLVLGQDGLLEGRLLLGSPSVSYINITKKLHIT